MLSTAHRVLDGDEYANEMGLYKLAHKNHPSTIWVRSSELNYRWLWEHYVALMDEYTYRYDKTHATSRLRDALDKTPDNMPAIQLTDTPWSAPPQCMPDYCKGDDAVLTTRPGTRTGLTSIERDLYLRIEELERKVAALGSHPQQLEMEI